MICLVALPMRAADQIKRKDGTILTGRVLGVSEGQVNFESHASNGSLVRLPYYLTDIESVTMAAPATVTRLATTDAPASVISALEPQVKLYAGLPSDWVVQAMVQLAQAYALQGQADRSLALYNQIDTLYPGSKYHAQAVAGKARLDLKQGKTQEALAELQPVIDQANQNIAPSPADGALYADAFLAYGNALEAEKKPQQALEAYLTVKTMFYQNPLLAQQADQFAKTLRGQNPGLGIE